ncbi:hypothetical protein BsWGS_06963 [Bradybaena similaris]
MSPGAGGLLLWLFVYVVADIQGLKLVMDRTPGAEVCGKLKCEADVTPEHGSVLSIVGLRVFKTARGSNKRHRIASVSVFDPVPHLELVRSNLLNVSGGITRHHGDLSLEFRDESDCLFGWFLCELNFVNVTGHPEVMTQQTRPEEKSIEAVFMSRLAAKIESHQTEADSEFAQFQNRTSHLEDKIDNVLKQMYRMEELRGYLDDNLPMEKCVRGMPRSIARVPVSLFDNFEALCDTHTDGGGWIVIQRRANGVVDFKRKWADYKTGFGTVLTDYWLGNDVIHKLTSLGYSEIRFDLKYRLRGYFAQYSHFSVADEANKYQLTVAGYRGTAGDSFSQHNTMYFSTSDADNDNTTGNCAYSYDGAWWFNSCYNSNLNGIWGYQGNSGVVWNSIASETSLTFSEMKIRKGVDNSRNISDVHRDEDKKLVDNSQDVADVNQDED